MSNIINLPDHPGAGERWIKKDYARLYVDDNGFITLESEGLSEQRADMDSPWEEKETSIHWTFVPSRIDCVDVYWSRPDMCFSVSIDNACITRCKGKPEAMAIRNFILTAIKNY